MMYLKQLETPVMIYKRSYLLLILGLMATGFIGGLSELHAQNMMTELSEPAELNWYNQHFSALEDSVTHYQEAMKLPQIPAERRSNLAGYQQELSVYRSAMRRFIIRHGGEDTAAKALLISCFREIEINRDTLISLASLLTGAGSENKYARYLAQELKGRANNEIGKDFIDFTMPDDKGQQIHSEDFRGKYLLINFWASWCGPCRAEMPAYLGVYHRFKNNLLEVIAVSVDTDKTAWLRAKKQDQSDWLNVFDGQAWNSAVVRDYAIHRIPQNILIGPEGHIVAKNISAQGLIKLLGNVKADTSKATNG